MVEILRQRQEGAAEAPLIPRDPEARLLFRTRWLGSGSGSDELDHDLDNLVARELRGLRALISPFVQEAILLDDTGRCEVRGDGDDGERRFVEEPANIARAAIVHAKAPTTARRPSR